MTNQVADRLEQQRDLRRQIQELNGRDDGNEIIVRDTSPSRRKITLYSMTDGEAISVSEYIAEQAMKKSLPDGRDAWTADPFKAPEYRRGQVKCFLHAESAERPILSDLGISNTCAANTLANNYSKRIHAQHRHRQEWAMYQEYLNDEKENTAQARADRQLEATLAIAGAAAQRAPGKPRKDEE